MQELSEETIGDVLGSLQYATEAAKGWAKAWHNWALFNVQVRSSFWIVLILQGSTPVLTCMHCDRCCLLTVSCVAPCTNFDVHARRSLLSADRETVSNSDFPFCKNFKHSK